jgi:hypothetical protein
MNLFEWATRWGIPHGAVYELRDIMGQGDLVPQPGAVSEAGSQKRIRVEAANAGHVLWRNNVGACVDDRGNHIRYGLCNESMAMNKSIKSSDLIGITTMPVTTTMVGQNVGIFTAVEVKKPGWKWRGDKHEVAQHKFILNVVARGGIASFQS